MGSTVLATTGTPGNSQDLIGFLEKLQVNSKIEWKVQIFPIYSLPPHRHGHPHDQHPLRLLPLMNVHRLTTVIQSPQLTVGFTLGLARSMALVIRVMTGIHYYIIIPWISFIDYRKTSNPKIHTHTLFIFKKLNFIPLKSLNFILKSWPFYLFFF